MLKTRLDPNDRAFLDQMHRQGPATIQEICASLGVTATAVRQRLSRLQGQGFVTRETVRAGRGRPHHTYCVTENGLRELGDNYADLAMILWQEIQNIDEPAVRSRLLDAVREAMVNSYGKIVRGSTLEERVRQLRAALVERGFDVEVDSSSGLPILRENNCPYLELATSDPTICELEQTVFQKVLGTDLELAHCCLDGHHCCEFHAGEGSSRRTVAQHSTTDTLA